MPIRMTGMVSGLDTDSIVKELVSAYSTKKEKYEKERTKLGWKQEIWKSLNKEVNSFYKSAGNLRFDSGYNTKKTTSSDSTKATVSASGNATVGTQKLHVLSTAQSGYLTGAEIKTAANEKVTTSTKLSDLGVTADEITFNVGPAPDSHHHLKPSDLHKRRLFPERGSLLILPPPPALPDTFSLHQWSFP